MSGCLSWAIDLLWQGKCTLQAEHAEHSRLLQVLFEAQGRGGKNKAVDLEDMKFHQCVRLARFENDRTISFIPPDGAFDLMYANSLLTSFMKSLLLL